MFPANKLRGKENLTDRGPGLRYNGYGHAEKLYYALTKGTPDSVCVKILRLDGKLPMIAGHEFNFN